MEFIKQLFQSFLPAPHTIEDEFFGTLTFIPLKKNISGYWEAKHTFAPTGDTVEVFIVAQDWQEPPTTQQRQFFTDVEARYESLIPALQKELEAHVGMNRLQVPFDMQELIISAVHIPAKPDGQWELNYECNRHHYAFGLVKDAVKYVEYSS
jgi:hypothetical protein